MLTNWIQCDSLPLILIGAVITLSCIVAWTFRATPLRHIPGPWLNKYFGVGIALAEIRGHRSQQVVAWHQQYGPIVCVAPTQVSIATLPTIRDIYSSTGRADKSTFFNHFISFNSRSVFTTLSFLDHKRKRAVLSSFYQGSTIYGQPAIEAFIRNHVFSILNHIEGRCPGKGPVDFYPLADWYAFDNITALAFGPLYASATTKRPCEERGLLRDLKQAQAWSPLRQRFPWLVPIVKIAARISNWDTSPLEAERHLAEWTYDRVLRTLDGPNAGGFESLVCYLARKLGLNLGSDAPQRSYDTHVHSLVRYISAEVLDNINAAEASVAATITYVICLQPRMGAVADPDAYQDGLSPRKPMQLSGALDRFNSFEVTPTIGTKFTDIDLKEWLESPDSDSLLRDLAITVSQRGVVFFRKQDSMDDGLQKELVQRLGELSGKPKTSGLHIHPFFNAGLPFGGDDNEIDVVSTQQDRTVFGVPARFTKRQTACKEWHTDITHEPVPSDYAMLRLIELPKGGGEDKGILDLTRRILDSDTLWASGYELYDRISKPYQKFLEGLTATFVQPSYDRLVKQLNHQLYTQPRGSPENVGSEFVAVHPVVRTNPVTGWKTIFAAGNHVQCINGLEEAESEGILQWFRRLITENHDLQVRYRWQNQNDVALWDNRCVFHAATKDINIDDKRVGHRAMGVGERPYLDPKSTSRREALGLF